MRTGVITATLFMVMVSGASGLTGRCVAVLDGDSLKILLDDHPILVEVRLFGVDCPDHGQPFAEEATAFTSRMALNKVVTLEPTALDRYGRTVAVVRVNGESLNHALVEAGLAWWFRHFAPGDKTFQRLEREARASGRGLWARPDPIPPWKWRRRQGPGRPNSGTLPGREPLSR
ncbi:MAG: thermonuclease family protein [Desulfomonilaceae bacterium]|nr:thermonuclease family protein [Desulfomonilaceae bacterium]